MEPGYEIALPRRNNEGHDSVFCDEVTTVATVGWVSHSVTQRKLLMMLGFINSTQPTYYYSLNKKNAQPTHPT